MDLDKTRIKKLKQYLFDVVSAIDNDCKQINVNMLDKNINNYSLDKIPTASNFEKWVTGGGKYRDVYSFRSRKAYSIDEINNLENIGFFEIFEDTINSNNKKGILPGIKGIQTIECLNCGALAIANDNTAEFDIQIQITYVKEG